MSKTPTLTKKLITISIWMLITSTMIFISFNRHSKTGIYFYRSQIFADKAGYYVYLPAAILYQFNPQLFPENIDDKTGNGFQLNTENNTVQTKYTYGVAFFQLPFFLIAHALATPLKFEPNGFSLIYHWAVDISAIFYFLAGLLILYQLLRQSFLKKTVVLTLFFLTVSTNLFYYALIDTGMSHVYSFFLFSVVLYLMYNWKIFIGKPILFGFLLGFIFSAILIIRPSNLIFLILILFINKDYLQRLKFMLNPYFISAFVIIFTLLILPQLMYWKYASGSFIVYSYVGESFSSWNNPKIIEVLFAPNNGHILYNPILLIIFAGCALMIKKHMSNAYLILTVAIVVVYYTASWWLYSFGCGYGNRNMVEYYSLLSIPLASIIEEHKNKLYNYLLFGILLIFSLYNLKMIYSYGGCWFGEGNWDWNEYIRWLKVWPS